MTTIQEINSAIMFGNLTNDQLTSVIDAVKFARAQIAKKNKNIFVAGSKVKFTSSRTGKAVLGTVSKVNRKYVIVSESGRFATWRVPANMLEAA